MNATEYWMGELANRSDSTRLKYATFLDRFCEWYGKSPDELVEQRKWDLKSDDPKVQRKVESALKGFIAHLDDNGSSVSTQQVAYAAIRSFFDMHYQPLRMRRGDYPTGEAFGSRAATKEDIRVLLEKASLRIKAMILFLKDAGLRVSDVVTLKYGHFAEALEKDETFIPLYLITRKNRTSAKTFMGPEAVDALKTYFEQRREGTRRIPPETFTENSPLFRTREPKVKALSRSGLSSTITYHAQKLGINTQFSAHSFRKYFQTQLEAAGVNPNWIDQMIGHKLINSRDSYSLPSDEQLKTAYMKAYSHLRVFKDSDMEARISMLETQVTEKDRIIEVLMTNGSDKSREIENLKTQLTQVQSRINHITESRRESDEVMNVLFEDPQFREFVSLKLKEFVKKNLR